MTNPQPFNRQQSAESQKDVPTDEQKAAIEQGIRNIIAEHYPEYSTDYDLLICWKDDHKTKDKVL